MSEIIYIYIHFLCENLWTKLDSPSDHKFNAAAELIQRHNSLVWRTVWRYVLAYGQQTSKDMGRKKPKIGFIALLYFWPGSSPYLCWLIIFNIWQGSELWENSCSIKHTDSLISGCYGFPGVLWPVFHMFRIRGMCYPDYTPVCVWEFECVDICGSTLPLHALTCAKLHVWLFVINPEVCEFVPLRGDLKCAMSLPLPTWLFK